MTAKDSASLLTRDNSEEPVPAISIDAPESKVESSIGATSVSGAGCADSLKTCAKVRLHASPTVRTVHSEIFRN